MANKERKESNREALLEARSLVCAMRNGMDVRDLMEIRPVTADLLQQLCEQYPADAYIVRNALEFRTKVRDFMDKILAGDLPVSTDYFEDVEETEDQCGTGVSEEPEPTARDTEDTGLPVQTLPAPDILTEAAQWTIQGEEEPAASEAEAQGPAGAGLAIGRVAQ